MGGRASPAVKGSARWRPRIYVALEKRVLEPGIVAVAHNDGPPVVGAGLYAVDLVVTHGAVLRGEELAGDGMPRQALGVAVAEGVDGRAGEGVVLGNSAVLVDSEDLACQGVEVLGQGRGCGVAGGYVELTVGPKLDAPAVVDAASGDVVQYDHRVFRPGAGVLQPDHSVLQAALGIAVSVVDVQVTVGLKVGVQGQPQEATFSFLGYLQLGVGVRQKLSIANDADGPLALG